VAGTSATFRDADVEMRLDEGKSQEKARGQAERVTERTSTARDGNHCLAAQERNKHKRYITTRRTDQKKIQLTRSLARLVCTVSV
jgi:hypothetical protein